MISLLCDFAFVPMTPRKWNKVLNKWIKNSKKYDTLNKDDRLEILDKLKKDNVFETGSDNFTFLTKRGVNTSTGKKYKRTVGIANIHYSPTSVQVSELVGNPLSQKDPKFKGAVDALETRLTVPKKKGKKLMIAGINPTVDKIYKDRFKDML